ncbi:MAG: PEP-CTERM sorting domain-containing protein [Anaerolineaceae bacterium]|nr:PEP-CTERM sorting domain-containing protein [Anaerolineaceae bacterium]
MAATSPAEIIVNPSGQVADWGITPFSQTNQANSNTGNRFFTIADDYAPIDYPNGIGRVPSPGGTLGEAFDLEEMHLRTVGNELQVLVVTSSAWSKEVSGTDYTLGDLFLEIGGTTYGVVTQSASQGLAAGAVYRIDKPKDTEKLQKGHGSYRGKKGKRENDYGPMAKVEDIAGPWAVDAKIKAGQLLGAAGIDSAIFDYGGDEDGTFLIEYKLDWDLLGADPGSAANAHIAWGCGNDVIEVNETMIPEPATMALLGLGLFGLFIRRRK